MSAGLNSSPRGLSSNPITARRPGTGMPEVARRGEHAQGGLVVERGDGGHVGMPLDERGERGPVVVDGPADGEALQRRKAQFGGRAPGVLEADLGQAFDVGALTERHAQGDVSLLGEVAHLHGRVRGEPVGPAAVGDLGFVGEVEPVEVEHGARRDRGDEALGVLGPVAIAHEERVPEAAELLVERVDEAREARAAVGEPGHVQHDDAGGALAERTGEPVRHVAELRGDAAHAFARGIGDGLPCRVVEHEADGGRRDAARARDILHGDARGGHGCSLPPVRL